MDTVLPDPPLAPRLVVGAAIVDDLDRPTRLLAARRTGPPDLAGGWELPGGKVDPGEDSVTALQHRIAGQTTPPLRPTVVRSPSTHPAWPHPSHR